MPSTYTTNLRLTKQADGENPNTWGEVLNEGSGCSSCSGPKAFKAKNKSNEN